MFHLRLTVSFLLFFILAPIQIMASCGAAQCPVESSQTPLRHVGDTRLQYQYEYIDQDQPHIGRRNASVGEISGHHDEIQTLNVIQRLIWNTRVLPRFNLGAELPFIHREHSHIHHHMGTPGLERWNFSGMGDLVVNGAYDIIQTNSQYPANWNISIGVQLPTGRSDIENDSSDEAETSITPGKEASAFILGTGLVKTIEGKTLNGLSAKWPFFLTTRYQWNEQGKDDYRIGNSWLLNIGTRVPVFRRMQLTLQTNLQINRRDDKGLTGEEIQKTGGTHVYATPGLAFNLSDQLTSFFLYQLPVYQRVNRIQLVSESNFIAGLSYQFNVAE